MHRKIPSLALATCLAAWVLSSFAAVSVSFVEPEHYTDLSDRNGYRLHHRDAGVLSELEKHFQTLSQRYLAAQQTLRIEVLDIDRAGHFEPWRSPYPDSTRILRSVTWPRMKLRYTLEEHGQ